MVELVYGEQEGDGRADTVDIVTGPGFDGAKWRGIVAQLQYTLSPTLSVAGRAEHFQDRDGFALFPQTAVAGDYNEVTVGLQWRPSRYALVRPELRYDWQSENDDLDALNHGREDQAVSLACDVVLYF